jgi:hypothetical protein
MLVAATAAFVADRAIPRRPTADRWTRDIELVVPVSDPAIWPADDVARLLCVLTNDRWTVTPYRAARAPQLTAAQLPLLQADTGDSAALFSGGLDSFGHAVSLVRAGQRPLLIGHWDMPVLAGLQRQLATAATSGQPSLGVRQFHAATPLGLLQGGEAERTSRSRGFLFAAAGIAVAAAAGHAELHIPENGLIAVNVPLTAARGGALSTRSTHPRILQILDRILYRLGVPVRLMNPWLYATKGDVARAALAAGREAVAATVSCSHPSGDRWRRDARYRNCGYCYPCLVRRAGIEAVLDGTDPTTYRYDPRRDTEVASSSARGADLAAVAAALHRPVDVRDLFAVASLPAGTDLSRLHEMRERSFTEIKTMLHNGLAPPVRARLGM